MQRTFDVELRVLSCERCGAPARVEETGGSVTCEYCGVQMLIGRRRLEPARLAHTLEGEARLAALRLQTGRPLPDNPYSTVRPPPGCESLTRSGLADVQEQLARRFREAAALVRAAPRVEHQRLLWWCATMLNQGYGMGGKHLERRAVLERAIEELRDPGFRHLLFVNLAGAAASLGALAAARAWIERCDPAPEDVVLDSAYRVGLASVLVREGDAARVRELVGARVGDVPEAHQYRLMFAMYRIHAHERLGDPDAALAAAAAIQRDPEVGGVLVEALGMNSLAPATAAALTRSSSATTPVGVEASDRRAPAEGPAPRTIAVFIAVALIGLAVVVGVALVAVLPALR